MLTIRSIADVRNMLDPESLPRAYARWIEAEFSLLYDALADGEEIEQFSLQPHGYIVILQAGDDVRDLSVAGLNPESGGLLGSMPEYIDTVTLENGTRVYKIGVLYADDYMMFFYSEVGIHDDEVEAWLAEEAEAHTRPHSPV